MQEITRILSQVEQGHPQAAAELLPLVYEELCHLARHKLAQEKPGQTLESKALVHEAYLRLVDANQGQHWNSRGHFFAAAALAMRRILVDNARRKHRQKRGGDHHRVELPDVPAPTESDPLLDLDEALTRLAAEDPLTAQVVNLRQFAGLSHAEVADALQLTVYQVRQKWAYAKAWLSDALKPV